MAEKDRFVAGRNPVRELLESDPARVNRLSRGTNMASGKGAVSSVRA